MLIKLGVIDNSKKREMIFKYTPINEKPPVGINHHISPHTMSLQRSRYLCLDDNTDKKYVL